MKSILPCCICSDTSSRPATRICTIKSALPWSASNAQANTVMQSSGPCERPRRSSSSANGTISSALSVSLALKATTQSTIVSKLSAYARNNRTKRALWEYDNLIQSLYLLNYIDSASLRQNVQRAVNRGESYHQLRRTVSYANYGKLRFGTEYEQHLWSECSRLIANCIIFYNATLLSKLLAHKESRGDMQGAALVKQVSPVAWQHINLYGRYEFRKRPEPVDVDEIVRELAEIRIGTEPALAA